MLHTLDKLAVAAEAEEIFTNKYKLILDCVSWDVLKKERQSTNLKELLFLGWERADPDNSQNKSLFDIIRRSLLCKKNTEKWDQGGWEIRVEILYLVVRKITKTTAGQRLQYDEGMSVWDMQPTPYSFLSFEFLVII